MNLKNWPFDIFKESDVNPKKFYALIVAIIIISASSGCEYDVPGYEIHMVCDENNDCAPATQAPSTPKPTVTYTLWVRTGSIDNADTDGDVFITIIGDWGRIDRWYLDTDGYDDFESGANDWFIFTVPNMGKIHTVCIEHENSGENQGWYLEEILIESDENNSWYFPFDQWLADDDKTGNLWTCQNR